MKRVFYFIFLMSFCIPTGQAQNDIFTGEFSQQELNISIKIAPFLNISHLIAPVYGYLIIFIQIFNFLA